MIQRNKVVTYSTPYRAQQSTRSLEAPWTVVGVPASIYSRFLFVFLSRNNKRKKWTNPGPRPKLGIGQNKSEGLKKKKKKQG